MMFLFNLLVGAIIGSGVMFILSLVVVSTICWSDYNWENFYEGVFTMTMVGLILGIIAGGAML